PDEVLAILRTIGAAGHEAYVVGGAVRDSLMGITPGDWDIATSATPEEIKGLFEKTVDTGIKHGTVTVLCGSGAFEVTTFRTDGEYRDGRRPENVFFSESVLEDLSRRDFTINAMAYSPEKGLVDPFGG